MIIASSTWYPLHFIFRMCMPSLQSFTVREVVVLVRIWNPCFCIRKVKTVPSCCSCCCSYLLSACGCTNEEKDPFRCALQVTEIYFRINKSKKFHHFQFPPTVYLFFLYPLWHSDGFHLLSGIFMDFFFFFWIIDSISYDLMDFA